MPGTCCPLSTHFIFIGSLDTKPVHVTLNLMVNTAEASPKVHLEQNSMLVIELSLHGGQWCFRTLWCLREEECLQCFLAKAGDSCARDCRLLCWPHGRQPQLCTFAEPAQPDSQDKCVLACRVHKAWLNIHAETTCLWRLLLSLPLHSAYWLRCSPVQGSSPRSSTRA